MNRMDLFTTVHKGLRTALFETTRQISRTDFHDPVAAARAAAAVTKLVGYLDEHAEHEDNVVMPVIERLGPAVFVELHADHNRVGGLQREIEELAGRLAGSDPDERVSVGRRLQERLARLVAEHLVHMEREETTASRLLWAHLTDDELTALHRSVLTAIPPARMAEWAEIIVPSVNPGERQALLAGLRLTLPEETFARVASLADGGAVTAAA